jgi:hypothetical protein
MSSNDPIEYDPLAGMEEKIAMLEERLRWTTKRLIFWEMLLWHLYDLVPNDVIPLKEIVEVFIKQSLIAELEVKAKFSRRPRIIIAGPGEAEEISRRQSEHTADLKRQIRRLKRRPAAEIVEEFKGQGGEVWGEVLMEEVENM